MIEGTSRLFISKEMRSSLFSDEDLRIRGRSFIQKDEKRGFALVPNFQNRNYHINSQGFRGEEFPKNFDSKFKILALGESTTFGWDVNDTQTYPYYLQQEFQKKEPNYYVINGGIPSYTSTQTLLYMKEILEKDKIKPNLILVNILWNDLWYSSVKNWHPNILVHQKPPLWLSFLTKNSYFFHGLLVGFTKSKEREVNLFNQRAYEHYMSNLKEMILLAQKYKTKIAFVEPPFDADHMAKHLNEFQIQYSKSFLIEIAKKHRKSMHKLAKKENISVLNHALSLDHLHQKEFFIDALHPTAHGNQLMAKEVVNLLF